ncbi:hypothetical protein [Desulfonema limicola]|nr:hypothetical protein [Desulfonema limicola]
MVLASAIVQEQLYTDFPQGTMPIDEYARKKSSEADPNVKRIETQDRDWLVPYCDAYKNSEDIDNDKVLKTSLNLEITRKKEKPLIQFPHFKEWRQGHFLSLRKWEGVVEDVFDTSFVAIIKDVDRKVPDERVEISFDELTNIDEIALAKAGAIFSWTMGYSVSKSGTRRRQAVLLFRRMPKWTKNDIEKGFKVADEMYSKFGDF